MQTITQSPELLNVLKRAAVDKEFRALCLNDSTEALSSLGMKMDESSQIRFSEHFVEGSVTLPPYLAEQPMIKDFVDAVDDGSLSFTATATGSSTGACSCRSCCV